MLRNKWSREDHKGRTPGLTNCAAQDSRRVSCGTAYLEARVLRNSISLGACLPEQHTFRRVLLRNSIPSVACLAEQQTEYLQVRVCVKKRHTSTFRCVSCGTVCLQARAVRNSIHSYSCANSFFTFLFFGAFFSGLTFFIRVINTYASSSNESCDRLARFPDTLCPKGVLRRPDGRQPVSVHGYRRLPKCMPLRKPGFVYHCHRAVVGQWRRYL